MVPAAAELPDNLPCQEIGPAHAAATLRHLAATGIVEWRSEHHVHQTTPSGFPVMRQACDSCIYRQDSPLDLQKLEAKVSDPHVGFNGYRVCHHHHTACCRGFWNRHKDEFQAGQMAQRLDAVVEVDPIR